MGKLLFVILYPLMLQLATNLPSSSAGSHNSLPPRTGAGGKPHPKPPKVKPSPPPGDYPPSHPLKLPFAHPPSPPSIYPKYPSYKKLQRPGSPPPPSTAPVLPTPCPPPSQPTTMQAIMNQLTLLLVSWAFRFATTVIAVLAAVLIPYLGRLNSKINALKNSFDRLQLLKDDVALKTKIFELRGHVWLKEVDHWLEKVERILKEATQLINRHLQLKRIFCFDYVQISIASSNLLAQVETLLKEGVVHVHSQGMKPPPAAVEEQPINSSTYGLDSYLNEAAEFLANDEENILGIVGMGGIGKTTLLKRINNELQSGSSLGSYCSFDLVIWVVVSKDYTPQNLSTKIAKALELQLSGEDLPKLIFNYLRKKNFLLLLDDVWESLNLEEVGLPAYQGGKQFKRKVILTTRILKVCVEMKVKRKIKVDTLNKTDAWLLFKDKISEDLMSDENIRLTAQAIAEECKGLPLALNSIGRAMAIKPTITEWREAIKFMKKSKHLRVPDGHDETFQILMLSYDSLQNDTDKQCFLSCALWPEDWKIDVRELIRSWIGFGFLDCNSTNNFDGAYRDGIFLVGRLKMTALLEHDPDDETQVWLHDVIRDMALWIANEEGRKPNKWMVINFKEIGTHLLQEAQCVSLLVNGRKEKEAQKYPLHCSELLNLTVFSLGSFFDCAFISQSISPPKLRYLDLQHSEIAYNTEEIGSLENLVYLNLSNTAIRKLPDTMRNLRKLRFLLLRKTWGLDYIPYGWISSLSELQVLDLYNSKFTAWGRYGNTSWNEDQNASIDEVLRLSNSLQYLGISVKIFDDLLQLSTTYFTRSISLIGERNYSEDEKRKMIHLVGTVPPLSKNLKVLRFEHFDSLLIFEEGWTLPELETLRIWGVQELIWQRKEPAGVAMPSLRELYLFRCYKLENITWVMQLRSLEYLEVSSCFKLKQVIAEGSTAAGLVPEEKLEEPFRCLRALKLKGLHHLISICDGEYTFLSLKLLEIRDCTNLRKLPFGQEIIRNAHLKIHMEEEPWESIMSRFENEEELKLYYRRAFQSLGSRYS